MKKYYMTKTCKLLSKSENIKAIDDRNKEILDSYDFTKVLNKIQSSIDKVQGLSESGTLQLSMRLLHSVYEEDGISGKLYKNLDRQLIRILHDDFDYNAEIENIGGSFFGSYYLILDLGK